GGRNGLHIGADHCLRDSFNRNLALAVCDQHPLRHDRHLGRPENPPETPPPEVGRLEIGAALLLGWIMTRRDADHPAPMLPIDLFRRPMFALSAATSVCSFAGQGLAFVSLPFFFEDVLHRSQVETGFFMTPWPLVVAIMAPIGGRLSDRYPVGILGGIGLVLLGIGMALLATIPPG